MLTDGIMNMAVTSYIPGDPLKPFIKEYLIIESSHEVVNRILPDTSLAIAFRVKGRVNYLENNIVRKLPLSVITGLRKSARLVNYLGDSANIIVLFKEGGASAFFKEPLHAFFEESLALDAVMDRCRVAEIEERLNEAGNHTARIAIVENFMLSLLHAVVPDKLVIAAIQQIRASKGILRIKDLADALYISPDAFEKRFRKTIGASPKQFSSIIRMKTLIATASRSPRFTDIALDAGYFDQAHFNKEFKLFTGQAPTEFFREPSSW